MINIIITFYPEAIGPFSTNYLLARPNKQWKWPFLVVPITKQATPLLIQQLSNPLLFTKRTVDLKRRKSISPTVRTHAAKWWTPRGALSVHSASVHSLSDLKISANNRVLILIRQVYRIWVLSFGFQFDWQ